MANYPTLPTEAGSDPEPLDQIKADRAEDGTARVRSLGSDKMRFRVVHPLIDSTDKSTLSTFYSTNRLLEVSYTSPSDGSVYTCIFTKPPSYERINRARWTATVMLEEV
jgi:hypothetical protein